MRVYKQKTASNIKIHLHSGDICRLRAKECLHEIANQCEDLQSNWYNEAHKFAISLSELFNIDLETVCKVIATLSPMQRWETNKRQAYKCLLAWNSGCIARCHMFSKMNNLAFDILNGKDIELGPKTGPFCESIFNPNFDGKATIDSVAVSILVDMHNFPGSYKITSSELEIAQSVYNEVAKELNVTVPRLQAATWVFARKAKKEYHGIGNTMVTLFDDYTSTFVTDKLNPYQYANILREII